MVQFDIGYFGERRMTALSQRIEGEIFFSDEHGVLVIDPAREQVYLRYALTEQDEGGLFFPELLLDDWGHEIKTLELYRWIQENGEIFPRAELFGYDFQGNERQYFLRELDLLSRYPCYGYSKRNAPLNEGLEVAIFVIASDESIQPQRVPETGTIAWPMSNAAVSWWRVNSKESVVFAKSLLGEENNNIE